MGNGIYGLCIPDRRDISDLKSVSFRNNEEEIIPKDEDEDKIEKVQSNLKSFKNIEEINKKFDEEFLISIGEYVDREVIFKKRGEELTKIEEEFNREHGCYKSNNITEKNSEGINDNIEESNNNTYNSNNTNNNISSNTINKSAIRLFGDFNQNAIYEGNWKYINNLNTFTRYGYGCLNREDSTKIEGIWRDKIIQKGRIYFNSGKIYEGEILTQFEDEKIMYYANGNGVMQYSKDFNHKRIISQNWFENLIDGEATEIFTNKFTVKVRYNQGVIDFSNAEFIYPDNSRYVGQFNKKYKRDGNGILYYENGNIYEGEWKNNKYNGLGLFFCKTSQNNNFLFNPHFKFGEGIYTKGHWIHGLLHGEGSIQTKENLTHCMWRFGKLIQSSVQLISDKIILNENIFNFLNDEDLVKVFHIKNRNIRKYFTKDNYKNLLKLKVNQMINSDLTNYKDNEFNISFEDYLKSENNFLLQNLIYINNIREIIINFNNKINEFIPIVAFRTDGGVVQKRFHYSNIFNPDDTKAYCSNYLIEKKNDIEVTGGLNVNLYENNKQVYINHIKNRYALSQSHFNTTFNQNSNNTESLLSFTRNLIPNYESILNQYKIDYYQIKIEDQNILESQTIRNSEYLFSIHQVIIKVPIKLSFYTILGNPVRTLAIYISNDIRNISQKDDMINYSTINSFNIIEKDSIITNKINMNNLNNYVNQLNKNYKIMKVNNNDNGNVSIEFDTNDLNNNSKLLSMIFLKDYENPHIINLKNYYHIGKYITVKLIDQLTAFNYEKTGIDIGSVLFFGQVYSTNN